jgi:hypothetical protein
MNNKSNLILTILSGLIVIAFFVLLYLLASKPVPDGNSDVVNLTVGALIGAFTSVVGYWFGSSAGSKQKTDLLANK